MGYAIIYKPAAGEVPAVIVQVLNNEITPASWVDGTGHSYINCVDHTTLETELSNLDADWTNVVERRYYMKTS